MKKKADNGVVMRTVSLDERHHGLAEEDDGNEDEEHQDPNRRLDEDVVRESTDIVGSCVL